MDKHHNTYHCSVGKKPINADYFAFTKHIETNLKAPKLKVVDRVIITISIRYELSFRAKFMFL